MHTTLLPDPPSPCTTKRLESTVALLVTGGGRGIGRDLARRLAAEGAAVGVVARSGDELAGSLRLIEHEGGIAVAAIADVTDPDDVAAAIDHVGSRLGPIDVLVNNAGVAGPVGPLWDVDPADWWRTVEVNLRGVLVCTQQVLPDMVARGRGRILNLSSQAGVHRWPLVSAYSVSKAAVTKLTENLAHEVQRHGITVLSVHPGLLPVGMTGDVTGHEGGSTYERQIARWIERELAEGRGADPERAIELLLRLAAGDGDLLTGRHLSVHDDLDVVLSNWREVVERDLYVLHPEVLP